MNLRFAYSTTLARPEFREMAPFQYFDFIENEKVQGNTELTRTLINNFDLRYEVFPGAGELVAFSLFYKRFINPLESILIAAQNEPIRSYANAASANNYGAELELRKNFSFLSDDLKNFSFVGNLTLVKSKIKVDNSGSAFQENERPLQGQAEYVFNFGLYFDDFETGFNSSLVYNKVGSRISRVGFDEVGDIIEKPVDLIDFSVSKKVFDYFTIKLNVKDLLNQEKEFIQQTSFGDKISELKRTGRTFSVGLAYQL
jgi:outer membrane receptor protein involved in Fe transport